MRTIALVWWVAYVKPAALVALVRFAFLRPNPWGVVSVPLCAGGVHEPYLGVAVLVDAAVRSFMPVNGRLHLDEIPVFVKIKSCHASPL